ncbi:F0F1 ATP synthase subunit A [Patescibacteria group bacterium]|uniref:ATP synthase subunit a n=1 Tax=candidate division WWE3 bacterium TaxID=2053526 RepID=A0A928TR75_UNCKA|nr:F0F1 ATP synthase subunit A [candidate division WWE3 bacterium]MCL4732279.1 F0F1 ATP synthase subunit A [Patescibacteria group bacterium]MDL1953178.1 F0F1 ATP synthase subunit A [Candidatus Uhrbacteria bacterium UHB]RIL00366.1 MAG: ATP synthase F0 subunit A [Candidatus Uhrbacteria bacterium]
MNIPLFAEPIASIGGFRITNAFINATFLSAALIAFAFFFRAKISLIPGRLQTGLEMLFELLLNTFDQVTGDPAKTRRFFPFVATLFFFILLSNWLGLLPGTGSLGIYQLHEGNVELIPILRSAAADLNLTLALALLSVVTSHVVGMLTVGFFVHWNKFIQLGTLWQALKTKNILTIFTAIIELGVGLIELISEAAKVLSLSLRLFGNIFAGEVLITVLSSILAFILPLPFMGLELIVGVVQATVFSMLTLVYLSMLTEQPTHDEHKDDPVTEALEGETLLGEPALHTESLT